MACVRFDADQQVLAHFCLNAVASQEGAMRFYFDVRDGVPVRDKVGREFRLVSEAIEFSKTYARTLRGPGNRRDLRVSVINEHGSQIHEEPVYDQSAAGQ
jgi:hypothetical protein